MTWWSLSPYLFVMLEMMTVWMSSREARDERMCVVKAKAYLYALGYQAKPNGASLFRLAPKNWVRESPFLGTASVHHHLSSGWHRCIASNDQDWGSTFAQPKQKKVQPKSKQDSRNVPSYDWVVQTEHSLADPCQSVSFGLLCYAIALDLVLPVWPENYCIVRFGHWLAIHS